MKVIFYCLFWGNRAVPVETKVSALAHLNAKKSVRWFGHRRKYGNQSSFLVFIENYVLLKINIIISLYKKSFGYLDWNVLIF